MQEKGIWKYCTPEAVREFILSLGLLNPTDWNEEKQLACLYAVSNHTERHYQPAVLRKQDGGVRRLLVPDPLLMKIQRNILHHILEQISVSEYARAYYPGASLLSNALPHVGSPRVLKLDLKDFFGTITYPMVYARAFPREYFPPAAASLLSYLCCYRDYLPQGAPTSAAVSNLVMKPFDDYMGKWCRGQEIVYTRYCDDMTFSGDFDAHAVQRKARGFLEAMGFALNDRKTQILPSWRRQKVTGVVVNQKPQVSRAYRRKLRQEIYHCTRHGVASHLQRIGGEKYLNMGVEGQERYLQVLLGKIHFVLQINPNDAYFHQAKAELKTLRKKLLDSPTV